MKRDVVAQSWLAPRGPALVREAGATRQSPTPLRPAADDCSPRERARLPAGVSGTPRPRDSERREHLPENATKPAVLILHSTVVLVRMVPADNLDRKNRDPVSRQPRPQAVDSTLVSPFRDAIDVTNIRIDGDSRIRRVPADRKVTPHRSGQHFPLHPSYEDAAEPVGELVVLGGFGHRRLRQLPLRK